MWASSKPTLQKRERKKELGRRGHGASPIFGEAGVVKLTPKGLVQREGGRVLLGHLPTQRSQHQSTTDKYKTKERNSAKEQHVQNYLSVIERGKD